MLGLPATSSKTARNSKLTVTAGKAKQVTKRAASHCCCICLAQSTAAVVLTQPDYLLELATIPQQTMQASPALS